MSYVSQISKELSSSDTSYSGIIYLPIEKVREHILQHLNADTQRRLEHEKKYKIQVILHDQSDGTTFNVFFGKSGNQYVFSRFYQVVTKHKLNEKDMIDFHDIKVGDDQTLEISYSIATYYRVAR
ncbi:putative transcription factor B3-Domain family [Helianthus anomalus]